MKTHRLFSIYISVFILALFINCKKKEAKKNNIAEIYTNTPSLQIILDNAQLNGSILIYDIEKNIYYSNDFEWAKTGRLPASTFKIPNTIIGLETGVIANDSTKFKWDGINRSVQNWNQDLVLKNAFHYSCVPCYQKIARKIGSTRMKNYLQKLNYDKMVVNSTNIDLFWLEGDSKINQFQQIDFLKRFTNSKLPITKRTHTIMKNILVIDSTKNYTISGKTGWSIRNNANNGWFVGYIKKKDKMYYFATNITPKPTFNMGLFPSIRKIITYNALKELNYIIE